MKHRGQFDLQALFEMPGLGAFQAEAGSGRLLRVTPGFCEITGYSERESLELALPELTHPGDREECREHLRRAAEAGGYEGETRYLRKDGSTVWVHVSATAVGEGRPPSVVAVVRETPRRTRDTEEERLAWQSRLLDLTQDAVFVRDTRDRISYWNREAEEQYGWSSAEVLGLVPQELLKTRFPEPLEEIRSGLLRNGRWEGELRHTRRDGTTLVVASRWTLERDADGQPLRTLQSNIDITERKRVELELARREARLRSIVEAEPECVKVLNPDGSLQDMNAAGLAMIEADTLEQARGRSLAELVVPEHRAAFADLTERVLRGEPGSLEFEIVGLKGTRRWLETQAVPLQDAESGETTLLGVTRDTTGKRRTEEELKSSLKELADLKFALDESAIVAFTDQRGRITYVNDKFCEISRYSREELIGRDHRIINSSYHDKQFISDLWRTIARGRVWRGELRNRAKDGSIYWVDTTIVPFLDDRGKPYQYVAIRYEVTERKRVEQELRERNTLLGSVIEGSNDAIYLKDSWGRYLMANSAVARVIGKPVEEIVGNTDAELLAPEVAGPLMATDREIMLTDETRRLEETLPVAGSERIFYSTKAPYRDHEGQITGIIGVSSDITELKKAEEQLKEIREAERGRIARELHDVVLQDLAYALQTIEGLEPEGREAGTGLEEAATALRRSVGGLRTALQDLGSEEESAGSFARSLEALVELNRRMNAGCEFELEVEDGFLELVPQESSRELLRIVQEALTNVRRHSGARRVRVHAGASGTALWLEITDDGRGFDREEASTGLGTRGMNQRARALGGDLQVKSRPGAGTTVRFELRAGDELRPPEPPPAEKVRVLLVDDHAAFRQGVASAMERQPGFEVVGEAESLREARGVLAARSVDVGIFDLGLQDGYGGDLIRELRSANPQAQALILSATEDRLELARAVEAGAAGIIHKSAAMSEIVDSVRRLQAGERILPLEEVVEMLRFAGARREQEFEVRQRISQLTDREREVLEALAEGLDADEISRRLHISAKTERNHVASILAKLGVHSRLQALVLAIRHGLVDVERNRDAPG